MRLGGGRLVGWLNRELFHELAEVVLVNLHSNPVAMV